MCAMLRPVAEDWEQEEALRRRLASLADAARLPLPAVEVVPDRKRRKVPAYVKGEPGEEPHIHVTEHLVTASPAEQDWHLAACLGWWASPVPRRRFNEGRVLATLALVPHLVWAFGQLSGGFELPKPVAIVVVLLLAVAMPLAVGAVLRRNQRALEDAGRDVLRAAGRDPAAVAREAFGGRDEPVWWNRAFDIEPTPAQRIAAAENHQIRPQQPLF